MAIRKDIQIKSNIDNNYYVFLGSQWRNVKTGRIASSEIAMDLESSAITQGHVYGENIFSDILQQAIDHNLMPEKAKISVDWILERNKDSRNWTRNQARRVNKSGATLRSEMFADSSLKRVANPIPGNFYMYLYDAKNKDTLKYWDYFPVMLCADVYEKNLEHANAGWIGFNLHYLPILYRVKLMDYLYSVKTTRYMNEKTKIDISRVAMASASKSKLIKPTIHRYIRDTKYVKSQLIEIPPNYWSYIAFLPLQRFMKASTQTVWRDSLKNM